MIKKIVLLTLTVVLSNLAIGQISNVQDVVSGVPLRKGGYDYVEGTPYFEGSEWKLGSMTDVAGKVYGNAQLRFNCFDNELEYMRPSGAIIVRKEQIKSFDINLTQMDGSVETYTFSSGFQASDKVAPTEYVRVIYAGDNFSIVEKIIKKKISVTPAAYGEKDYEKFIDDNAYFFIGQDKSEEIKLNKKNFYDLFPGHKNEIKEFVKKYGINFFDLEEVNSLANYIDKSLES